MYILQRTAYVNHLVIICLYGGGGGGGGGEGVEGMDLFGALSEK